MRSRPDVWSAGLVMVDDLYVEGRPSTPGLLGGGAGDAFCSAFAAAIAQGRSPVEAAQVAVQAGAHMVQHAGTTAALDGLP